MLNPILTKDLRKMINENTKKLENIQNYSSEEQIVGTWIDGKPIYRKVINIGKLQATKGAYSYNHGISNIAYFTKVEGIINNGTEWFAANSVYRGVNNYTYEKIAENYTKLFPAKENLHILMIQHYAGSNNMGMVFRPYYLAREWVKRGYKVDIIAASYSHLRVKNPEIEKSFKKQEIDGIVYHWVKTRTYEGNGIKRAFSIFDFVGQTLVHASEIAKTLQPDVIIAGSTYMLDTYIGQKIRRKTK